MKFENALVALRKGYIVQRKSLKNRLNGVSLFMKEGKLFTLQTHPLSDKKVTELNAINANMLLAEDWEAEKLD